MFVREKGGGDTQSAPVPTKLTGGSLQAVDLFGSQRTTGSTQTSLLLIPVIPLHRAADAAWGRPVGRGGGPARFRS